MYKYIEDFYKKVGLLIDININTNKTEMQRAENTLEVLKKITSKEESKNVLEIGPESGLITKKILDGKLNISLDVLEYSENFALKIEKKESRLNSALIGDICKYEFELPSSAYDIVLLQEVLEHTYAPFAALVNVNKILKDNGYLYLTIPNTNHCRYILSYIKNTIGNNKLFYDAHIAEISPRGLLKLSTMSGFELVDIFYYNTKFDNRLLGSLFSAQVGFLLKKAVTPETAWQNFYEIYKSGYEKRMG